mmetsp:Transcript_57930/g.103419  ORF Transcript_57930/g.103419 Transcript_57930/m.103419 type:complete len:234 (+) Transcript_57930:554-1255(+)
MLPDGIRLFPQLLLIGLTDTQSVLDPPPARPSLLRLCTGLPLLLFTGLPLLLFIGLPPLFSLLPLFIGGSDVQYLEDPADHVPGQLAPPGHLGQDACTLHRKDSLRVCFYGDPEVHNLFRNRWPRGVVLVRFVLMKLLRVQVLEVLEDLIRRAPTNAPDVMPLQLRVSKEVGRDRNCEWVAFGVLQQLPDDRDNFAHLVQVLFVFGKGMPPECNGEDPHFMTVVTPGPRVLRT